MSSTTFVNLPFIAVDTISYQCLLVNTNIFRKTTPLIFTNDKTKIQNYVEKNLPWDIGSKFSHRRSEIYLLIFFYRSVHPCFGKSRMSTKISTFRALFEIPTLILHVFNILVWASNIHTRYCILEIRISKANHALWLKKKSSNLILILNILNFWLSVNPSNLI